MHCGIKNNVAINVDLEELLIVKILIDSFSVNFKNLNKFSYIKNE